LTVVLLIVSGWFAANRAVRPWTVVRVVAEDVATAPAEMVSPNRLLVVAYNIAHGRGQARTNWVDNDERQARLGEIAGVLRDVDADIVVLNEVDFASVWSAHINQAESIARLAGYPYRVEQRNLDAAVPFVSLRFGNAVLSKYPIIDAQRVAYPGLRPWESMLVGHKEGVVATIMLPGGRWVRVAGVHLEHRDEGVRIASAEMIAALTGNDDVPLIAAGDFNSTRVDLPKARPVDGTTAVSRLLDGHAWKARPGPMQATFPATDPDREIDWILATPQCTVGDRSTTGGDLSDHLAVIAEVELPSG
jgi:endonuclease/exonuclease/phosphatase family metal-dependent hydrolase